MLRKGSPSKYWFLSRPRRFGKSLLIDTLENIFKGNRELFKGTYIYDNYDFEEHPVIRLNMSLTPFSNEREMLSNLYVMQICDIARKYGIEAEISRESSPAVWLHVLIAGLYRKYGKTVVVLLSAAVGLPFSLLIPFQSHPPSRCCTLPQYIPAWSRICQKGMRLEGASLFQIDSAVRTPAAPAAYSRRCPPVC